MQLVAYPDICWWPCYVWSCSIVPWYLEMIMMFRGLLLNLRRTWLHGQCYKLNMSCNFENEIVQEVHSFCQFLIPPQMLMHEFYKITNSLFFNWNAESWRAILVACWSWTQVFAVNLYSQSFCHLNHLLEQFDKSLFAFEIWFSHSLFFSWHLIVHT